MSRQKIDQLKLFFTPFLSQKKIFEVSPEFPDPDALSGNPAAVNHHVRECAHT